MNILLINEYFPPFAPGGAEWSTLQLGRSLVDRGHTVTVVTPNYGTTARETMKGGVNVVRFPYPARLKGRRTLPVRWLASPLFYLWSALWIAIHARRVGADVLHAQNKYSLPGAWLAGRLLRRPVVITLRDTLSLCAFGRCLMRYDALPEGCGHGELLRLCRQEHIEVYIRPRGRLHRWKAGLTTRYIHRQTTVRRWFLERADGVVSVSRGIEGVYRAGGVRLGRQSTVVYNIPPQIDGIPAPDPALRAQHGLGDGPLVVYVGKFSPGKGTADLAAAADLVAHQIPNVRFAFIGGDDLPGFEGRDHIRVLGRRPHDEVLRLYALADLVVVPSVWPEPLSRVLLEAMAMGRAVVGTRVGGTPELVEDGVNGLLVPRSRPEALAEAIQTLLRDPARRAAMGAAGRRLLAERFDAARSVDALVAFYESVGGTA